MYVYDRDGRRFLDCSGGAFTVTVGHCIPEIIDEISSQLRRLTFVNRYHFTNEPAEQLAELIVGLAQPGFSRVFYAQSGAEAVEASLKLARQYQRDRGEPGRYKIVGRMDSFHGATLGALSVSGSPGQRHSGGWEPLLLPFPHIERVTCRDCPYGLRYPTCRLTCASDLERTIEAEGPQTVAAFIADPWRWVTPPDDYWPTIREICDRYGVLLIVDEILTGFGRTGRKFAMEHWNVLPDVVLFGKGVNSGYAPLSGMLIREHVFEVLSKASGMFAHGHTFSANPLACSAALAVQRYIERRSLYERVAPMGKRLRETLLGLAKSHPSIVEVDGKGLFLSVILELPRVREARRSEERNRLVGEMFGQLRRLLIEHRMIAMLWPHGRGVALQFSPPFIVEERHLEELAGSLDGVLSDLEGREAQP
jgi:adenosylmethionine-8-amino-7-oxononanoate aminotransferase